MSKTFKKSLMLGLSITGAIIGVGFASGREVVSFFARYGYLSIIFCLLTGALFLLLIYLSFDLARFHPVYKINMHKNKKCNIGRIKLKSTSKTRKLAFSFEKLFDILTFVCQIVMCSAMLAGLSEVFLFFGFSGEISVILRILAAVFGCLYIYYLDNGVYVINFLLSILLIILIFVILICSICMNNFVLADVGVFDIKLISSPFLYVGINVFTIYPLLMETGKSLSNKKERFLVSFFTGVFVSVLLSSVCFLVLFYSGESFFDSMVMVSVAKGISAILGWVYLIIVLLGILTTMLSTAYGSVKVLGFGSNVFLKVILCVAMSLFLSFIGFSRIVDYVYPLLGLVCLIFVVFKVVFKKCKNKA